MGIKKIDSASNTGLPWINDYLKAAPARLLKSLDEIQLAPLSIKIAQSGKGYMLKFESFQVYVWKSSAVGRYLEKYCEEGGEEFGIELLTAKKKPGYELGIISERIMIPIEDRLDQDLFYFSTSEEIKADKDRISEARKKDAEFLDANPEIKASLERVSEGLKKK
jgi:hypothetical protein